MTGGCIEIIQIDFTSIPSQSVEVASITNSFIIDGEVLNRNPSSVCSVDFASLEKLAFLNLQVNDAVLLVESNSRHNPANDFNQFLSTQTGSDDAHMLLVMLESVGLKLK